MASSTTRMRGTIAQVCFDMALPVSRRAMVHASEYVSARNTARTGVKNTLDAAE